MFPVSVHSSNLIWFGFQKISTTQVYIFELTDLFMFWHFENTSPMEDRHLSETKSRLQLDGHQNIEPLAKGPVSQKNQFEKLNLPKKHFKSSLNKRTYLPRPSNGSSFESAQLCISMELANLRGNFPKKTSLQFFPKLFLMRGNNAVNLRSKHIISGKNIHNFMKKKPPKTNHKTPRQKK